MNPNYYEQNLQPFQIRFENALKEPLIITKCKLLADLINETLLSNLKEIQQRFVLLIEDIFSFNSTGFPYNRTDWRLRSITKEANLPEFNSIFDFLHTNGTLLKLIRYLVNDPSIRYDFPITCLPLPTRTAFEDGLIPNFYSSKISQSFSNSISLNAFEFFIFHFAYFITNQNLVKGPSNNYDLNSNDNTNVIYYVLLENYMEAFIPIPSTLVNSNDNKNSFNEGHSLWKSLSSTTSNILNLASSKNDFYKINAGTNLLSTSKVINNDPVFSSPNMAPVSPLLQKSSIMNSKIFSLNKFQQNVIQNYDSHDIDILGTTLYKCETLLNIFTEFWFNHVSSSLNLEDNRNVKNTSHCNFNFTVEHMRVVRIFIKHLHYFSNSNRKKNCDFNNTSLHTQYNSGGIVTSEVSDPLDDLRRNLWSSKYLIQKKLYQFLRIAFDRWPNDSSFRVPLETWLSYIQPWRYVSRNNTRKHSEDQNDSQNNSDISDCKRFISENLFFYTIVFRQVINRISKIIDLNSTSSVFLLYRITKVFSQNHLCDWIKEAELNLLNGSDLTFNLRHNTNNLLSPSIKQISSSNVGASIKHALMEMEPGPLEYVSLFSHSFRDQIINLLLKIAKHLNISEKANQSKDTTSSAPASFITSIVNFINMESSNPNVTSSQLAESSKNRQYLETCVRNLSSIFEIQQQSVETIMSSDKNVSSQIDAIDSSSRDQSAYEVVNGIPKLSEYGRNMFLNGTLKRDNMPNLIEGNPDTQPVRTFEIEYLVKIVLFLSVLVNKRYGTFFVKHYDENNFLGNFLQQVLSPPVKYIRYLKVSNSLNTEMVIESLPPRVNLRFLASKTLIYYSVFAFSFCRLCNFPFLSLGVLLFVILISYLCTKSMLVSLKAK